jgi:hypothetical protein
MRIRRKKGPNREFTHQEGCKLLQADPSFLPEWQEVERGFWKAECQCGIETYREPPTDDRVRLSPYDPATARHLPQCEYIDDADPAVLKILLTVKPGLAPGYNWVTCAGCEGSWQLPHYASERP